MWETLVQEIQGQSWIDWLAVVTAILYLVLASRESPWCWFWGIISCTAWAYAAYFVYDFYQDALLQLFYVGLSFWGLYQWGQGQNGGRKLPISVLLPKEHAIVIVGGLLLSVGFGWFFSRYTEAAAPYWDALTTVFSVIITFMVVYKKLDNWIYWMVIDSIYVFLYWSRGGYLFSLLFVIYLVIVVLGYIHWRSNYRASLE